jgi:DnaK suppressor protein
MPLDHEAIRHRLQERRNQLVARSRGALERVDEELDTREIEEVENSSEQWDARLLTHLSHEDARALETVTAAMIRLEDGAYGVCIDCGETIDEARLDAIPEAARCARDEDTFERERNAPAIIPGP